MESSSDKNMQGINSEGHSESDSNSDGNNITGELTDMIILVLYFINRVI